MGLFDRLRAWLKKDVIVDAASVRSDWNDSNPPPPSTMLAARSGPHLLLLKRFLHGAEMREANDERWAAVLRESETAAVARLESEGLLVEAPFEAAIQSAFQAKELKAFARERGLKVSGTKPELAQRLIAADATGSRHLLGARRFLICSDQGKQLADAYVQEQKTARAEAEQVTLELLKKRRLQEAAKAVASFEAKQVFARGLGIDWEASEDPVGSVGELESIFSGTPQILAGIGQDKLDALRIAAGMDILWGTNAASRWLPEGFESGSRLDLDVAARMLIFYASHKRNLAGYSSIAKRVRLSAVRDEQTCAACQKIDGQTFAFGSLPELPYAKCTSEMGCRCMDVPLFV